MTKRNWLTTGSIIYNLYERPHGADRLTPTCNEVTLAVSVDRHSELSEADAIQFVSDALKHWEKVRELIEAGEPTSEERINNAAQAASETSKSWRSRCYRILGALGLDFGSEDFQMPDEDGGWVVTNGVDHPGTLYRTWNGGMSAWTTDIDEATRYLRRKDAEDVHQEDEGAIKIVPAARFPSPPPGWQDIVHHVRVRLENRIPRRVLSEGKFNLDDLCRSIVEVVRQADAVRKEALPGDPPRYEPFVSDDDGTFVGMNMHLKGEWVRWSDVQPVAAHFQTEVYNWAVDCFGLEVVWNRVERGDRLLEEVLELLQSGDYPQERIPVLADYVYGRPKGVPGQELGGTMVTLAAYSATHDLSMQAQAYTELERINQPEIKEKIRKKQASKANKIGPLP